MQIHKVKLVSYITVKLNKQNVKLLQEVSTNKIECTKYYLPKLKGNFDMDIFCKYTVNKSYIDKL